MDFKGWFRTVDGSRCDPLTIQDQASRYLIRLVAVERMDGEHVWAVLDAAFREFGLPKAIRSDNGAPFASTGAGGLSALSVRLIKAGVLPERIAPASPQQNGRLERLHLTLKQDTASPPAASLRAQARSLQNVLPGLQRGASARGAGHGGAGLALCGLDARLERSAAIARVRERHGRAAGTDERRDQVARRAGVDLERADRRAGRHRGG